jgi:pimeloyl-ACP methyl ester carboxylesterase
VIAIDLPGHGASSNASDPDTAYPMPGLAATVGDVLEALNIKRTAIFGWSLGGHIAIEMLATNPVVAGIFITGAPPLSRGPLGVLRAFRISLDGLLASKEQFSTRDAARFLRACYGKNANPDYLKSIERADGRLRKIMSGGIMRGVGADQRRTVESAHAPVAVVNGEYESFGRLGYINGLRYSSLWDNTCHVIPGAGHAPFIDRPDLFDPLLSRFTSDVATAELSGDAVAAEPLARSA